MTHKVTYRIAEVEPYINWPYFFHAWQMNGKPASARHALRAEAREMLAVMGTRYRTHALFSLVEAGSDGDDIVLAGGTRLPMLRQQAVPGAAGHCLCLADFVRPLASGRPDRIGLFAATVDAAAATDYRADPWRHMLAVTLADRLAEATAECMHARVRKYDWGYAPDEQLTVAQLLREDYRGIRPAVGYPSMPDLSLNFLLDSLLDYSRIGIRLTENGMMRPHASVSGLMLAHPQARYFNLGKIGDDQLADYARRRGLPIERMRKFLYTSLANA